MRVVRQNPPNPLSLVPFCAHFPMPHFIISNVFVNKEKRDSFSNEPEDPKKVKGVKTNEERGEGGGLTTFGIRGLLSLTGRAGVSKLGTLPPSIQGDQEVSGRALEKGLRKVHLLF